MSACSAVFGHPYIGIDLSVKEKLCFLIGENRAPIDRGIMFARLTMRLDMVLMVVFAQCKYD
ncbi:MAG TPA: hypothetical protein DCE71_03460 [Parachlamydiales bacterium]|nr:hypothetical protein [Parachlamydiales bacterium]